MRACVRALKALFELSAYMCVCVSVADRLCLRLNPLKGVQRVLEIKFWQA